MKEILISCGIIQKSGVILSNGELEDVFVRLMDDTAPAEATRDNRRKR